MRPFCLPRDLAAVVLGAAVVAASAVAARAAPSVALPYVLSDDARAAAEDGVKAEMRDPDTAVFSDVAARQPSERMETVDVCGFVDGRNGYGVYAGKVPFYLSLSPSRTAATRAAGVRLSARGVTVAPASDRERTESICKICAVSGMPICP